MITSVLIGGSILCLALWIFSRPHQFPPGYLANFMHSLFIDITKMYLSPHLGPKGLPLLGCLLSVSQWHPGCSFMGLLELYYRYGPVCGFYIGPQPVISISGYEACKEAFMNENLNGRPDNGPARMKSKGKRLGTETNSSSQHTCTYSHCLVYCRCHAGRWRFFYDSKAFHSTTLA
jgi:hypothetical protein